MKNENIRSKNENPATTIPDAMQALMALGKAIKKDNVSQRTLDLIHLRSSQINGCSLCVDTGSRELKKAGETDERLFGVVAWREVPSFTDAERAALALAETVTRLNDRPERSRMKSGRKPRGTTTSRPSQSWSRTLP